MRSAVLVVALMACGPKPQKQCASSTAGFCVSGEVCDFNAEQGCQMCACKPWDNGSDKTRTDTGPTPPPNAPGPPIPVH